LDRNFCARSLRGLPKKILLQRVFDDFALVHEITRCATLLAKPFHG